MVVVPVIAVVVVVVVVVAVAIVAAVVVVIVIAQDAPRRRCVADKASRRLREAAHEPRVHSSSCFVAPNEVIVAVTIEIVHRFDTPLEPDGSRNRSGSSNARTVHHPALHGAGGLVAPHEIVVTVGIKVTCADKRPRDWHRRRACHRNDRCDRSRGHDPRAKHAAAIAPEDVGAAICIDVGNCQELKSCCGSQRDSCEFRRTAHLPERDLARRCATEENVRATVAREIRDREYAPVVTQRVGEHRVCRHASRRQAPETQRAVTLATHDHRSSTVTVEIAAAIELEAAAV